MFFALLEGILLPKANKFQLSSGDTPHSWFNKAMLTRYLFIFFGYYIYTFAFQLGHINLMYPFSSFDMYSYARAKKPYSKHLPEDFLQRKNNYPCRRK